MKQEFSLKWLSSKQPMKQRKYRWNAPLHVRRKMMASPLSDELWQKYKRRSFPIRKGDKVKVLRGQFKGTIGEVEEVNLNKYKIYVKGVEIKRAEGARAIKYPLYPAKVIILTLNLSDKRRVEALERNLKKKEEKNVKTTPPK